MEKMSKNWPSVIRYLLIPIMLIGAVFFFANQQTRTDTKYSEIVSLFKEDKVSDFTLDLASGNLIYKTSRITYNHPY